MRAGPIKLIKKNRRLFLKLILENKQILHVFFNLKNYNKYLYLEGKNTNGGKLDFENIGAQEWHWITIN